MRYRREIDGLRGLAVLPVILFHAGFRPFRGGFIGVDVFFVISGYLISMLLLGELQTNSFSILRFYERRARRILPALLAVMGVSSVFACFWMLPDELKNFGESVIATTLFSNNILLAITSDYWALASEFKPLLHTWTLGVEEQYYIFYPLFLYICWRYSRTRLTFILCTLAVLSFGASLWASFDNSEVAFYLLPTRAWEIFSGALAAVCLSKTKEVSSSNRTSQVLSGTGVILILLSIFLIGSNAQAAERFTFVPVAGSILIVLFATPTTFACKFLGNKALVGVGLISYSLYLWHQPLFAFARIYSKAPPSDATYVILILAAVVISFLSWRYIENPFRNRNQVSRSAVIAFSVAGSLLFVLFGLNLNRSYGMLNRMYDPRLAPVSAMDKRYYNMRVTDQFKREHFSDSGKLKILVIGNSKARDFINMTMEAFDTENVEIVYRDDFDQCIYPFKSVLEQRLYSEAQVIVFASWDPDSNCLANDRRYFEKTQKQYFYIGSKEFGYNLNWIARLRPGERSDQYNRLPQDAILLEGQMADAVPQDHYISLLAKTVKDGNIPITDENGYLISTDRIHLTRFGAIFFGRKVLRESAYGQMLLKASGPAPNRREDSQ